MALKVLVLRKRIEPLQAELEQLRTAASSFEAREAELEQAINEAATDEEREVVETLVSEFEQTRETNASEQARISGEIAELEKQIAEIEAAGKTARSAEPGADVKKRSDSVANTSTNTWVLRALGETPEQRASLVAREDVKEFLTRVRGFRRAASSVTGAELGVPDILMGVMRDSTARYSKLIGYVTLRPLAGKGRQNVAGTVPEGIWTEAVAAVNELIIIFTQVELDEYKVGGFVQIPNSSLEDDSDLQLLSTIVDYLGQAIGRALDRAIVYGTGKKMPVGFVTRLAADSQPAWWGKNQGAFTNLSTSNILTLDLAASSGKEFFSPILAAMGIAEPNYATGAPVWIMNRKTHTDLMCRCLEFNAAAALVSGVSNEMPVLGGKIVELEFMADHDIAGGFLSLEVISERSGAKIAYSDAPMFLEDCTVFKGTQRYDGKPVRGEAFVLLNYANTAPTKTVTFPSDTAN